MGTAASLLGGMVVGFTVAVCLWVEGAGCLIGGYEKGGRVGQVLLIVAYGAAGGVLGSLVSVWSIHRCIASQMLLTASKEMN